MMYWNLVWIWGHPEVYVLILPAFGIYSEIASTFSGKPLFGYSSMVYATVVITILSWLVWLHHFFTMGSGASVNSFFGIATMVISIPTGVKIFNWLFTMYRGQIRFELPMMWVVAFMLTFTVGGMTGVLLAVPPADFVLHNSLFLVAHFHNVIIGGVVFGMLAGVTYWFPKAFGFKLDPFWGQVSFWGWVIGYWVAWTPMYITGLMGVTRRLRHLDDATLQPYFIVAAIGAVIIAVGIFGTVMSIVMGILRRNKLRDVTGDPWNGRTLEWSTASPPPAYNFALAPVVHELDAWYDMKSRGYERPADGYRPIHMPRNTGTGVYLSLLALAFGFGMIWYIWWLAGAALLGLLAVSIGHTFNYNRDYFIPADDVTRTEVERARLTAAGA
jgi:cytochrome o ubiquinol oxidase subunit 1